jgi:glycosyltransferase involved in cell wall biosynthesis
MEHTHRKKQRLLLVTDFFYPHWTGLSKSLYYALESIDSDIDCTVLTVRTASTLPSREVISRTQIIREDPLFTISRAKYSFSLLLRFLMIVSKSDTVLINSPCTNVLPVSIMTKIFGKKLLIFHQGDLILPKGLLNKFLELLFDISSYISLSLADKVSTYTTDYAKHSRILRPHLSKFSPLLFPLPAAFYQKRSLKKMKSPITFGFAGRFVEEKGFDILYQAIPTIKKSIPDAEFYYAGESMAYENFYERNRKIIEQSEHLVKSLGLLDEKSLLQFYADIDFMIIPSRSDCFNLVQAEAMMMGTPCISSNIPGLRYLVKETGFGILFTSDDPIDLAEKTIQAVANRKEILLSYTIVRQLLDKKKHVEKVKQFITE